MSAFNHEQTVSSATWTIAHNLTTSATAVDVYVDITGTLTKILPLSVEADTDDQITVTFSSPRVGRVRVIG